MSMFTIRSGGLELENARRLTYAYSHGAFNAFLLEGSSPMEKS